MRSTPSRGLLWRFALGLLAFALVVLGVAPAAVSSESGCGCPCERAQAGADGDVAQRPSCCPGPDERVEPVPAVELSRDADSMPVASPVRSTCRAFALAERRAPRPNDRGPPRPPPPYIIHRALLL